ncbi:unnamed protein product, partial [Mesorhabditis belari]|uniref:Uncharacterized protein n=1 Tax=Mesorhabditis belari TaxID=2138241 RepID=A0AAF3EX60_9BILA
MFVPSLQSCLSLLHSASNQQSSKLLQDARHCISEFFQNELNLLEPYLVDIDMYCLGKRPRYGQRAPPSSSEERSSPEVFIDVVKPSSNLQQDVLLSSCRNSLPATPLNDSGFCSSIGSTACSPDGTHRLTGAIPDIDSDCSPPKMRRLSSE